MRKTILGGSLIAALLSTSLVVAQPPQGGPPREGDRDGRPGDRPREGDRPRDGERREGDRRGDGRGFGGRDGRPEPPPIIRALDANGDGQLSAEEIANATKALKSLDTNNDGVLSGEEFDRPRDGRPGGRGGFGGGPGGPGGFGNMLSQFDQNQDGKISKDEAPERMRENFDRMDANGDGFIDETDMQQMMERFRQQANMSMADRIKEMDKDGDGKISKEEAPERMREGFDRIDTNSDGFVDATEMQQMFDRFRQGGGRGGEGGRGPRDGDRPRGEGGDRPERPKAEFE